MPHSGIARERIKAAVKEGVFPSIYSCAFIKHNLKEDLPLPACLPATHMCMAEPSFGKLPYISTVRDFSVIAWFAMLSQGRAKSGLGLESRAVQRGAQRAWGLCSRGVRSGSVLCTEGESLEEDIIWPLSSPPLF